MGDSPPTVDDVLDALHDVIDPELGYNVVDLGLVREAELADGLLKVTMTMTTPGCPAQDYITSGVRERALMIDGIADVDITLEWEPPWSVQQMTPTARLHFGIPDDGQ
jgi:metal-sulfur cluster biosynthetic enzyme